MYRIKHVDFWILKFCNAMCAKQNGQYLLATSRTGGSKKKFVKPLHMEIIGFILEFLKFYVETMQTFTTN